MDHAIDAILQAVPLFKALDATELDELAKRMAPQDFARNQPIMVEGHPPPGLYVLVDGKVAVMKGHGENADHICDLDAGECVGEVEIIENANCSASVVAHGDVKTVVITKKNLDAYFVAVPTAAIKVLTQMVTVLAKRLAQANINYSTLKDIAEGVGDE